jgi:hypothetical protein
MVRTELAELVARVLDLEQAVGAAGDLQQAVERVAARCEVLVEVSDMVYDELVERLGRVERELADVRLTGAPIAPVAVPAGDPATGRHPDSYDETVSRVRAVVLQLTPADATVAVVSKGDPALVDLAGRDGWHFPRQSDGGYLGHYPRHDADAVAMLEEVRLAGAEFLVFPSTSLWWLEFYRGFAEHLQAHHATVVRDTMTCAIFRLVDRRDPADAPS